MSAPLRLGFLGIGAMGSAMAANLLKAGCKVTVCDKNQHALDKLCSLGASAASSPVQLGLTPGLAAIISMLPSPVSLREAYLGPGGLLQGGCFHPPLVIDSSTVDPHTSREMAEAVQRVPLHPDAAEAYGKQHPDFLDAPVSGGVAGASMGTLSFMCGGRAEILEAAKPVLMKMGSTVWHCGDVGAGSAAKLANNLVLAISMAGVAEGLALGQRLGLDPLLLTQIFHASSAQCWALDHYNPCPGVMEGVPAARGYTKGFSAALMVKDLTLAQAAAAGCGAAAPMTKQAAQLYTHVADKDPGVDFSAIFEYVYSRPQE